MKIMAGDEIRVESSCSAGGKEMLLLIFLGRNDSNRGSTRNCTMYRRTLLDQSLIFSEMPNHSTI